MFWGLIMEPQRRYTQTVKRAFHISMAALDIASSDNDPTQVMCSSEERNYLLCTLQKDRVVQCALDLTFEVGDRISFATNGNSHVHLTGYLTEDIDDIMEEEDIGEEEEEEVAYNRKRGINPIGGPAGKKLKTAELLDAIKSESDDSDDESFADVVSKLEEEDDDDDEEEEEEEDDDVEDEDDESGEEEESEDEDESDEDAPPPEIPSKKTKLVNGTGTPGKKNNAQAQKNNTQVKTPAKQVEEANKTPKQEKPKTPNEKKGKQEQKTPKTPKEQPKKRTVEGGVIIEDLKQGEGQVAKPGRICQVYYEGRLKNNNKLFDSTNKGPGFKFRLGKQEVIKGWDVGVSGMKVGGKRRIVCPAGMAYGQKGSPPTIPPNATLVFDIELKGLL